MECSSIRFACLLSCLAFGCSAEPNPAPDEGAHRSNGDQMCLGAGSDCEGDSECCPALSCNQGECSWLSEEERECVIGPNGEYGEEIAIVNVDTDPDHCGGCGVACAAGDVCSEGVCVQGCSSDGGIPCAPGDTCRDGVCVAACGDLGEQCCDMRLACREGLLCNSSNVCERRSSDAGAGWGGSDAGAGWGGSDAGV